MLNLGAANYGDDDDDELEDDDLPVLPDSELVEEA